MTLLEKISAHGGIADFTRVNSCLWAVFADGAGPISMEDYKEMHRLIQGKMLSEPVCIDAREIKGCSWLSTLGINQTVMGALYKVK